MTDAGLDRTLHDGDAADPIAVIAAYGDAGATRYRVAGRGRPAREPEDAAAREIRLHKFGAHLKRLREQVGLSPREAARLAQLSSPRKLTQYEGVCFPPGNILRKLAQIYGITGYDMACTFLAHSDPDLHLMVTGRPGIEPSDDEIREHLAAKARQGV
jgi:hypothetical protein